jgi:hypothetical protein
LRGVVVVTRCDGEDAVNGGGCAGRGNDVKRIQSEVVEEGELKRRTGRKEN